MTPSSTATAPCPRVTRRWSRITSASSPRIFAEDSLMEWSRPHAIEFAAAIGLGLLGLLMLARGVARSPDARSVVLLGLRGSALAILVVILLDPSRTVETRIPGEKPTAVFLIDGSRSMSLER